MKKMKNPLSLAVALLLILTMGLSGCGKATPSNGAENTSQADVQSTLAATETEPQLPMVKLRIVHPGPANDVKDLPLVQEEINKYMQAKLNCELEWSIIDWSQWFDKIPLIISSGEQADILFTAGWNGYYTNVAKKAFLPLDDLFAKYGQGIKEVINPMYLEGCKVNGKMYAIPVNKELAQDGAMYFRKDIADKYGLDPAAIKTIEDLEPVLEKVKQGEPKLIPLWASKKDGPGFYKRHRMYDNTKEVEVPGVGYLRFLPETGKMVYRYSLESEVYLSKLLRKWYQAGYINKDAATVNTETSDVFKSGRIWTLYGVAKPGSLQEQENNLGVKMVMISDGAAMVDTNTVTGAMNAINANCKDPDRAMMIINLLHTDKTFLRLVNNGVEGKHYIKVSDDVIKLPEGIASLKDLGYNPGNGWMIGNQFNNFIWDTDLQDKWEEYKKMNANCKKSPLLGFQVDMEPIKSEASALNTIEDEFRTILSSGSTDTEATLKKFNDKMMANGLQKIIDEVQRQYDEWIKTK